MIRKSLSKGRLNEICRPSAAGQPFRSPRRGDDATERLRRLTEALRQYGYDVPRNQLAGPEDITWID